MVEQQCLLLFYFIGYYYWESLYYLWALVALTPVHMEECVLQFIDIIYILWHSLTVVFCAFKRNFVECVTPQCFIFKQNMP